MGKRLLAIEKNCNYHTIQLYLNVKAFQQKTDVCRGESNTAASKHWTAFTGMTVSVCVCPGHPQVTWVQ